MSLKTDAIQQNKTQVTLGSTQETRTTSTTQPIAFPESSKTTSASVTPSTTVATASTSPASNPERASAHQKEVDEITRTKELSASKNKPLIPISESLSDEWMKKPSNKKAQDYVGAYLSKTNGKSSSSEVAKEAKYLALSLSQDRKKGVTKGDYDKVPILIEALHAQGISIQEYKKLSPQKQLALYRGAQLNAQEKFIDAITSDTKLMAEIKDKSAREKINTIADTVLKKQLGEEYSSKSEDERQTLIKNKSDDLISQYIPNWKEISDEQQEIVLNDKIIELRAMTVAGKSFDEFQSLSVSQQWSIVKNYKYSDDEKTMSKEDLAYDRILTQCSKENNGKEPTIDDVAKHVKADKSIDEETRNRLLKSLEVNKAFHDGQNAKITRHVTYEDMAKAYLKDGEDLKQAVQKALDSDLKSLSECKNQQEQVDKLAKILKTCGDNKELRQKALDDATKMFGKDVVKVAYQKAQPAQQEILKEIRNDNGVGVANAAIESEKYGDNKTANITAQMLPASVTREQGIQAGVTLANANAKCLDSYTTGVNQRSDAVSYSAAVVQSENMSTAGRAIYTESAVKTASVEQQVEYGREFAKLNYPEVTEGLAAASKYVDKSVRNQYNSYVEQAIKSYPPEQQAQIRKALETGKISAETLAKTEVVASSSNKATASTESSANKTGSANTATPTPATSNPIKQQATGTVVPTVGNVAATSARTSVTDTPALSSVSSSARVSEIDKTSEVSSSSKVSLSSRMSEQDTQELTEKTQVVLDKIEDFIKTQKASIEQYESEKAEKVEHLSDEDIVKAVASGEVSLADLKLSKEEVATLKDTLTVLFEKNSISTAYKKLVSKFGKLEDVFLRVFAENADSSTLRSFAGDFRDNTDVILRLFKYSKDNSLLALLPKDTIIALFGKDIYGSEIPQDILWEIISEYDQKGESEKANKFRVFLKEGAGVQIQTQTTSNNSVNTSMNVAENNSNSEIKTSDDNAPTTEKTAKSSNKQSETTVPQPGSDKWFNDLIKLQKSDVAAMLGEEKIETKNAKIIAEGSNKNTDLFAFSNGDSNWMDDESYPSFAPAFVSNSKRKGEKFAKKPWWIS